MMNCQSIIQQRVKITSFLVVLLLLLILMMVNNALFAADREMLNVVFFGTDRDKIYRDEKTKKVVGPLADLYQSIGAELNVDIQFVGPLPFRRMMAGLTNGTYHIGGWLVKTPEREQAMYYSEQALITENSYIVAAKRLKLGKQSRITTLQDMGPLLKTNGTEKLIQSWGTNLPLFIQSNVDKLNLWKLTLSGDDLERFQAGNLVEKGRAGAMIVGSFSVANSLARKFPKLEVIELPIPKDLYIVFSKKSVEREFVDNFDNEFSDLALRYKQYQTVWEDKQNDAN